MDTSLEQNCLAFDLNISNNDAREKEFKGSEILVDESKSKPSSSGKEEPDLLIDKLNQMKSENRKLTEMLIMSVENYHMLQSYLTPLVQKYSGDELHDSSKRKFEGQNSVNFMENNRSYDSVSEEGSAKRPREIRTSISKVYVRVDPSDTSLVVKDGYYWRKYGQKVTKANPSPRAYYKCSFAPSCLVKKKVQRSVADPSLLVATYEGEHNHQKPLRAELLMASAQGAAAASTPTSKCCEQPGPLERLDFTDGESVFNSIQGSSSGMEVKGIPQLVVEQMASSLTRNPSFTAAIAAAISERLVNHDPDEARRS